MQTQKDHVDAYSVQIGRMSSALLLGEIGHFDPPARRAVLGIAGGLVIALLIGIACGVYGLIKPGGNEAWRKAGSVIVEKETGNRFVLQDGVLHPVTNYASALLIEGAAAHVVSVHTSSLGDVARGNPVGLAGAPDQVPTAAGLQTSGWLLCLPADGSGEGTFAVDVAGVATAADLAADSYSLVRSVSGTAWVLHDAHKLRVVDPALPVVLGLQEAPVPVASDQWLDQVPDGMDLSAVQVPGAGAPGLGGRPVGTLLEYRPPAGGTVQDYLVAQDGLAPVDALDVALLQANGVAVQPVDAATIGSAPRSVESFAQRLPNLGAATATNLATGAAARTPCLRQRPEGTTVRSSVVTAPADQVVAGAVTVASGTGILAASVPVADGAKPDRYLVNDQGEKFFLGSDAAIQALGFGGVEPVAVPAGVLSAIPSGPDLTRAAVGESDDPDAAKR